MSIYAVEIPHQRKPIAWVADDEADFIVKVAAVDQELPIAATFEDAVAATRRDLSSLHVFRSADDAARGYLKGWDGHQSAAAMDALLAEVARRDYEIEDPRLRLQIVGAVWDRARDEERSLNRQGNQDGETKDRRGLAKIDDRATRSSSLGKCVHRSTPFPREWSPIEGLPRRRGRRS